MRLCKVTKLKIPSDFNSKRCDYEVQQEYLELTFKTYFNSKRCDYEALIVLLNTLFKLISIPKGAIMSVGIPLSKTHAFSFQFQKVRL